MQKKYIKLALILVLPVFSFIIFYLKYIYETNVYQVFYDNIKDLLFLNLVVYFGLGIIIGLWLQLSIKEKIYLTIINLIFFVGVYISLYTDLLNSSLYSFVTEYIFIIFIWIGIFIFVIISYLHKFYTNKFKQKMK